MKYRSDLELKSIGGDSSLQNSKPAILIETAVCVPGVQFHAYNCFLWQLLAVQLSCWVTVCADIKYLKLAYGSQAVMQQQYEKFSLMSFVQRVELHLLPAVLPVPCTGHVALFPSDLILLFYSPCYFYYLSVPLTVLP